jgi:hypothetical protein
MVGVMADAGMEALSFIRECDTEAMAIDQLCMSVRKLETRLEWLFGSCEGIWATPGHASVVLKFLSTPHFLRLADGSVRCLGGKDDGACAAGAAAWVGVVPLAQKDQVLAHMRGFNVLAAAVLNAEFPSASLLMAFGVFDLPDAKPDKESSKINAILTPGRRQKLQILQRAFNLQPASGRMERSPLEDEFLYAWPFAVKEHRQRRADHGREGNRRDSCLPVWVAVILDIEGSLIAGHLRPTMNLRAVMRRGISYLWVTSGVEQSFSKLKHQMGDQRLVGADATEDRAHSLLLMSEADMRRPNLYESARRIWSQVYQANTREHLGTRRDASTARKTEWSSTQQSGTETRWLATFHEAVNHGLQASQSSGAVPGQVGVHWTDSHQRELDFQLNKKRKRVVEDDIAFGMLDPAADAQRVANINTEVARRAASLRERTNREANISAALHASPPSREDLWAQRVYVVSRQPGLFPQMLRFAMTEVPVARNKIKIKIYPAANPKTCFF